MAAPASVPLFQVCSVSLADCGATGNGWSGKQWEAPFLELELGGCLGLDTKPVGSWVPTDQYPVAGGAEVPPLPALTR